MEGERAAKPPKRLSDQQVTLGLAVMTAVVLLAALWTARGVNPLRGDSYEYLYFDASRSVGYPAFLALIRLITGSWRGFGGAALVGLVSLLAPPFRKRLAPRFRQIIPATAAMGIAFHGDRVLPLPRSSLADRMHCAGGRGGWGDPAERRVTANYPFASRCRRGGTLG